MFWYMKILPALLCLLLQNSSATTQCNAGQRRNYIDNKCEDCPEGQYSTKPGKQISCDFCRRCEDGSEVVSPCKRTKNTICQCLRGFTSKDPNRNNFCFCAIGSGLWKDGKTCSECDHGFFTDKINSYCRKWRECKSGIKFPGNSTTDVVCKDTSVEMTEVPTPSSTSCQTPTMTSTTSSTLTSTSPSNKQSYLTLWLVLICVAIFLLIGLFYRKCKISLCFHNHKKKVSREDSVCTKPVEESGEKNLSLLV